MYLFRNHDNSRMLIEMPTNAARKAIAADPDRYTPTHATTAHRWVRDDGPHETALFLDSDNRIRRAG